MRFSDQIEFEFKELEKKIKRLKLIEMELNRLNVEGFEYDVAKIKSKLKNPNSLDEVEKGFDLLKRKIYEKKKEDELRREKARIAKEKKRRQEEREQRELEQLRNEANEQIKVARSLLKKAEKLNIPILEAQNMMNKARYAFESKYYKNAKNEAQQCVKFLNSTIKKHEEEQARKEYVKRELEQLRSDVTELINITKKSLEKAKNLGIPDLQNAEHFLITAKNSFNANKFAEAKSDAQKSKNTIEKLIEKSEPDIIFKLPSKVQYNFWKHHDITITNKGKAHAKNIAISFSKALETREMKKIHQLNVGEKQTLQINMKPTEAGDVPIDYIIEFSDLQDRTYKIKDTTTIQTSTGTKMAMEDVKSSIDIKRDFDVLDNNDLKFSIKIKNISGLTINDVDVLLKYDKKDLSVKGQATEHLGNVPNNKEKTAEFILIPIVACVHHSEINAVISYMDASNNGHTVQMHPKEVHCISPHLAEKPMTEGEFSELYENHSCQVKGIIFKGIRPENVTNYMVDSSKSRRYVVKNSLINGTHVIYLSSTAKDKSYYLLTAIIQSKNDMTHIGLRACSNNEGGINNFMNEILTILRNYIDSVQSAREVENVIVNKSIQIIDSVVEGGISMEGDASGKDESINIRSER